MNAGLKKALVSSLTMVVKTMDIYEPNLLRNELFSREYYLKGIEESDKKGQAFEALDADEAQEVIAFKELKASEKLINHGMHVVRL
jgi:hypothetical protein